MCDDVNELAKELGLTRRCIYKWRTKLEAVGPGGEASRPSTHTSCRGYRKSEIGQTTWTVRRSPRRFSNLAVPKLYQNPMELRSRGLLRARSRFPETVENIENRAQREEPLECPNALAKQVPSQPSYARTSGAAFDLRAFAVVRKLRNIIFYRVRTVSKLLASEPRCVKPSRASSLVRNSLWAACPFCLKDDALGRSVRPLRTPHELWRQLSDHQALVPSLLACIVVANDVPTQCLCLSMPRLPMRCNGPAQWYW
jgi:transposase-like protein